jgi:hypothetical protein
MPLLTIKVRYAGAENQIQTRLHTTLASNSKAAGQSSLQPRDCYARLADADNSTAAVCVNKIRTQGADWHTWPML